MNVVLLFSGLITFSIIAGFVALKFFPKNPLIKAIYIRKFFEIKKKKFEKKWL